MAKGDWAGAVYVAAEAFVERCLRGGSSLISSDTKSWTAEVADDFYERFVVNEHQTGGDFVPRLLEQLRDAPTETILLAADLLYVYYLPIEDVTHGTRRGAVERVLSLIPSSPSLEPVLDEGFTTGIATYGVARQQQWKAMRFLAEFARSWTRLDAAERDRLLLDPWAFKGLLAGLPNQSGLEMCALQHLVYPDIFESLVSPVVKARIGKSFAHVSGVSDETDIDRKLTVIRDVVAPVVGASFHFYNAAVEPVWQSSHSDPRWTFAEFARQIRQASNFAESEIDYKLELAERLARARELLLDQGDDTVDLLERPWLTQLKRAFQRPNNLTSWRQHVHFIEWCEELPTEAAEALRGIWSGDNPERADLETFLGLFPEAVSSVGARANILSYLLTPLDPQSRVVYKPSAANRAFQLSGLEPLAATDVLNRLDRFNQFLDELRVRVVALGGPATTRLEAQGMAWWVAEPDPPSEWTDEQKASLEQFRAGETNGAGKGNGNGNGGVTLPLITEQFARSQFLPRDWLEDIRSLLVEKRQVIFFGPPGTGKTWLAQQLASYLVEGSDRYKLVQFHPSYAYEDFVQGYRPVTNDGVLSYELRDGALLRIADEARLDPDRRPYILIIDEINRGNIAKVFGELLYLLEYRRSDVELQYSGRFELPENLYVIGTMNTADRSIALVDTALRRRFYFIEFSPTSAELKGVLREWLAANHLDPEPADLLDALNAKLESLEGGRDFTIGPSYFMVEGGPNLDHVWRHGIRPVLVERFYGRRTPSEIDDEFGFAALMKQQTAEVSDTPSTPDEEPDDAAV